MKKVQQALLPLLCCVSLIGCGDESLSNPNTTPDPDVPKLSKLTVALNKANSQEPIINAAVQVVSAQQKTYNQTTNASGLALFQLENGSYTVSTNATGYVNQQTNVTINGADKNVTLDLDEKAIVNDGPTYIFHSDYEDSSYMQYWGDTWGSGATYTVHEDVTEYAPFTRVIKLKSGTNWGFGAGIAWGNEPQNAIDTSANNYAQFYVKPTGFTSVEVNVQSFSQPDAKVAYPMSAGEVMENGWLKFEVPIPTVKDLRWFGLVFSAEQQSEVLLSNVVLINKQVSLSQPKAPAPVPSVNDAEVFSIYSDSLTENKFVSLWNENWWNAPIHSFGQIDGNNYSRYEIAGQGSEGGVVGIQYGIEYGSVDVSKHDTWNIDLYVEAGINKIELQLVSTDGPAIYEINNPVADQWVSYAIPFKDMRIDGGNALNTMQMQMAGIKLWGEAGKALFVDNFYFSGEAAQHNVTVNVSDQTAGPLKDAKVFVGVTGDFDDPYQVTTDVTGKAQLTLAQGTHKIRASASGYGITQQLQVVDSAESLSVTLTPLEAAPVTSAPVPTVNNGDVIALYSDTLSSPHWVTYWSDNWWNAPTHEEVTLAGNKTAKFTIIPDGVEGGVTGIQYGIEKPVNASAMTGMYLDFYATKGVKNVQFQLLSASGPLIYTLNNIETGKWISIRLPFDEADAPLAGFDKTKMQQLGMKLWGTTSDSVYLDNIYFY
ncbi:hypothetical protein [Aeromonas veronii]|uniref:hypothetical protein n=1 Tax=Aeromonas veronii TaxID=654 RepID=UPI003F793D34